MHSATVNMLFYILQRWCFSNESQNIDIISAFSFTPTEIGEFRGESLLSGSAHANLQTRSPVTTQCGA